VPLFLFLSGRRRKGGKSGGVHGRTLHGQKGGKGNGICFIYCLISLNKKKKDWGTHLSFVIEKVEPYPTGLEEEEKKKQRAQSTQGEKNGRTDFHRPFLRSINSSWGRRKKRGGRSCHIFLISNALKNGGGTNLKHSFS